MSLPPNRWLAEAARTVEIFSGILGKRIYLLNASESDVRMDDGYTADAVYVHFERDYLYEIVEFGLAHIAFGSDARRRDAFAEEYAKAIQQQAYAKARTSVQVVVIAKALRFIVGALEQERLLSLWKVLYPGSTERICQIRHQQTLSVAEAHAQEPNILLWLALVGCGHAVPEAMASFGPLFAEAFGKVFRGTFDTTLLAAKWLFLRIFDVLSAGAAAELGLPTEELSFETRLEVLNGTVDKNFALFDFDYFTRAEISFGVNAFRAPPDSPVSDVTGVITTRAADLDDAVSKERQRAEAQLQAVRDKMDEAPSGSMEVFTRKDIHSQVQVVDVAKATPYYTLTDEDRAASERIRFQAARVLGKKVRTLEFQGTFVDPAAFIQRRASLRPDPVFQAEVSGKGFRCLLLLDRSGSMAGPRTYQCERACRIIRDALSFPFVDMNVWGYAERVDSVTEILRFGKHEGFDTGRAIKGGTPTHVALQAAANFLAHGSDFRQIFLITDGSPSGGEGDVHAVRATRKAVLRAKAMGVFVSTLIVGTDDVDANYMFPTGWRWVRDHDFSADVVQAVTKSFMDFARRK